MAFPVVATSNTSEGSGTSHTVSLPATISSGDLLIVIFCSDGVPTITFPGAAGDWNEIQSLDAASSAARLSVQWREADGTEGASISVTTSASERTAHIAYRITGAEDPDTQAPEVGGSTATGTSVNPNPNLCTPTGGSADFMWMAIEGHDANPTVDAFPSTVDDNQLSSVSAGGSNAAGCGAGTVGVNAASRNFGDFVISASQEWASMTIAVHPAPAGTGGLKGPFGKPFHGPFGGPI